MLNVILLQNKLTMTRVNHDQYSNILQFFVINENV